MISVAASTARRSSESCPNPWLIQSIRMTAPRTMPANASPAAEHQPVLELEACAHPVKPAVPLAHEVGAVGVGADAERHDLGADDRQQRPADQRVDVPVAPEHRERADHDQLDHGAERRHHRSGEDEQVVGRVDEQEAKVAPAVAEARELRLAAARVVLDRELADDELLLGGADHHLGSELHPGRAQVEPREHVAPQRAHPAVRVVDAGAEQQVEEARKQRVADVAVVPRHRARMDVAASGCRSPCRRRPRARRRTAGSRRSRRSGRRRPSRCSVPRAAAKPAR